MEIGQRRLARRLSGILSFANLDNPAAFLYVIQTLLRDLKQVRTRPTGPTDLSVFDDVPDIYDLLELSSEPFDSALDSVNFP